MMALHAFLCSPTAVFHVSPPGLIQSTQRAFRQTAYHMSARKKLLGDDTIQGPCWVLGRCALKDVTSRRHSVVGIVTRYRLDASAIEFQ